MICKSSPKLASWKLEKCSLVWRVSISVETFRWYASDGYFQQDNAPCHKAQIMHQNHHNQIKHHTIISNCFLEHDNEFTALKWPPQWPDLNPIERLWDVVKRELRALDVHHTNLHQLQDAILSIWANSSRHFFLLNQYHNELRQF